MIQVVFFTSPESNLLPRLAEIFLEDVATDEAYRQLLDAREEYGENRNLERSLETYTMAITVLRQALYERILDIFSDVDERIHPKAERKLKQLAVFAITGGTSSKLYAAADAHENPYHAINAMHQPLAA